MNFKGIRIIFIPTTPFTSVKRTQIGVNKSGAIGVGVKFMASKSDNRIKISSVCAPNKVVKKPFGVGVAGAITAAKTKFKSNIGTISPTSRQAPKPPLPPPFPLPPLPPSPPVATQKLITTG